MTWYPDEKVCTLSWEWWHGHDTVMTESECNWTQGHQSGQHQAPCCHTQSQSLLSQSLHHRSPAQSKSTRTGNTDALSNHGMLAWCTWPLLGPILSPLSKNSMINIPAFLAPKSCSQVFALLLWKKGQKVMTWSWHQHDWIRVQLNTATSKWTTSSTMLPHTVTVAAVTIFAPQVPAQSKSTRTGNTDALSNHGMLAWCTWPLLGPNLSISIV